MPIKISKLSEHSKDAYGVMKTQIGGGNRCTICFEEVSEEDDEYMKLSCGHIFQSFSKFMYFKAIFASKFHDSITVKETAFLSAEKSTSLRFLFFEISTSRFLWGCFL